VQPAAIVTRGHQAVGAHARAGADDAVRAELHPFADDGARLHDRVRPDAGAGRDDGAGRDPGGRMRAGGRRRAQALRPPLGQAREVQVGIVGDDEAAAGGRGGDERGSDHDGPGQAGLERLLQPRLRHEGDGIAARRLQRGDACDLVRGVAPQFSAQRRNDLTQAN